MGQVERLRRSFHSPTSKENNLGHEVLPVGDFSDAFVSRHSRISFLLWFFVFFVRELLTSFFRPPFSYTLSPSSWAGPYISRPQQSHPIFHQASASVRLVPLDWTVPTCSKYCEIYSILEEVMVKLL